MHRAQLALAGLLLAPATALAQADPSFLIKNEGQKPIAAFFATPAGRANWGQDRLDGHGLAPGATAAIRLRRDGNCLYDLRVVFAGGPTEDRRAVDTCRLKHVAVQERAPRPRAFWVRNQGVAPIVELDARPAGTAHWEVNHLPGGPIAPGQARQITLPPLGGCLYDLKVRFADGAAREKEAADLCHAPEQTLR